METENTILFTSERIAHFEFCRLCKYKTSALACKAFPEGIPTDILSGKKTHWQPIENQNNTLFFELLQENSLAF